jgi:7,8-dihydropterin-6-yl-methyl-4-(beta-D-ribofuranosyl)aminobenzene 5'-phosphate synthase
MRIVTLIENLVYGLELVAEHGLSFYIEDDNTKIILDTGQTGNFIRNAEKLNIEIAEIDALVLSHGHYDHAGGLYPFLDRNRKAKVYAKKTVFGRKYAGVKRFAGIPFLDKPLEGRLHFTDRVTQLSEHIFIMPEIPVLNAKDTHFEGYNIYHDNHFLPDTFDDELYLALKQSDHVSILTSCSHRGITNICEHATRHFKLPVNLILGGFHTRSSPPVQMDQLIDYFHQLKPRSIGVSHCTGIEKFPLLSQLTDTSVFYNFTGKEINL